MKTKFFMMIVCIALFSSFAAYGQMIKRTDAVWARTTTENIVLDGKLDEASWAGAETMHIRMGQDNGIPGSGWYWENGLKPGLDPTDATIKFLAKGDSLYIGIVCKDKSIGAGLFNHFDGLLMDMRYRQATGFEKTPFPQARANQACELFYGWVSETWADTTTANVGALPGFFGDFGSAYIHPRPDSLKNIWDAVTTVQGISNDDAVPDTSWTTELKINLNKFGYAPTQVGGDIAMWSLSIYDADYQWPIDTMKQSGNRTWLQCPWGNGANYDHLRIFIRSDVTTTSGPVPTIGPDLVIPDGKNFPVPTFDGKLADAVWQGAPVLQMKYGDAAIRNAYPNTAKYRSGHFQPTVNGAQNPVVNPDLVKIKYFYRADTLYLGFDVADRFVQFSDDYDRWDGFRVTMNQRNARNGDSVLAIRRFTFRVDSLGRAIRAEDLSPSGWDSLGHAVQVKMALKGGTIVDTVGATPDSGYTAVMKISLKDMGYPAGGGDGVVFLGITHFDGDSFSGGSYGTRVWFMRENDADDGAAWLYMDPNAVVTDVAEGPRMVPAEFALVGNYPNPFNPSTTIKFLMSRTSEVSFEVYDVLGRLITNRSIGIRMPGEQTYSFNAANLASGTYYYRLKMLSNSATIMGKMMLLK